MTNKETIRRGPATPLPWYASVGEAELGANDSGYAAHAYWHCITRQEGEPADAIVYGDQAVDDEPPGEQDIAYLVAAANAAQKLLARAEAAEAERDALHLQLAAARKLMQPFATWPYSFLFPPSVPDDAYLVWATIGEDTMAPTVGDCRKVAEWLKEGKT